MQVGALTNAVLLLAEAQPQVVDVRDYPRVELMPVQDRAAGFQYLSNIAQAGYCTHDGPCPVERDTIPRQEDCYTCPYFSANKHVDLPCRKEAG